MACGGLSPCPRRGVDYAQQQWGTVMPDGVQVDSFRVRTSGNLHDDESLQQGLPAREIELGVRVRRVASMAYTRRYGTLADAMKHDEFRVKDIAGNDGVIVYELEHEVRTLRHPGFVAKRWTRNEL